MIAACETIGIHLSLREEKSVCQERGHGGPRAIARRVSSRRGAHPLRRAFSHLHRAPGNPSRILAEKSASDIAAFALSVMSLRARSSSKGRLVSIISRS